MYNVLVKFNTGITKVYNVIMMILLGLMSIWTLFEVIFREAGVSVPWLEEFTIYTEARSRTTTRCCLRQVW